ncbi:MAG TPA: SUMF1/EgtB/PvdO family nonheme iron enzyme [Anaerolineales bacterium]
MKLKKTVLIAVSVLIVGLIILYAWMSGLLRQVYLTAATEALLVKHGNHLVQIRFDLKDHMNQVYIPAGEFNMGQDTGFVGYKPHKVYLDAYWIDQVDVTNAMYALCLKAGTCSHPARYNNYFDNPKYADYPVVYVTWYAAQDFCKWEGGDLPTEAQWEKAARGLDGRPYPWGTSLPDISLLNYNGDHGDIVSAYDYLFGLSPYGVLQMSGNVRQWMFDWYQRNYYSISPYKNPQGPDSGQYKSLRGGAFNDNSDEVKTYYRAYHDPTSAGQERGFRCAQSTN